MRVSYPIVPRSFVIHLSVSRERRLGRDIRRARRFPGFAVRHASDSERSRGGISSPYGMSYIAFASGVSAHSGS